VDESKNDLDISVLIATYNRVETLRQTLESMTRLDRDGLLVEFVVVDNNSADNTKEAIESFAGKLSIRYLFEAQPGKNCALNKALNETSLGKLVVFTDDDVEPKQNWLQTIVSVSHRWPQYSVFGGKQFLIYPDVEIPKWASSRSVMEFVFGWHYYGDKEKLYAPNIFPFGANFWVRREVFADKRRFNEAIGPHPKNRIMGSETSLLKQLTEEGYEVVYSPFAVVGHRIGAEDVSIPSISRRAYRHGRGIAYMRPLCRLGLFNKHPGFWYLIRIAAIIRLSVYLIISILVLFFTKPEKMIWAMQGLGYNIESMRMTKERKLS